MGFAWLGRLAIGLAMLMPLALVLSCEFLTLGLAWHRLDISSVCMINHLFGAPPTPDASWLTPPQIVPEWYLLPFYGVLRAITASVGPLDSKTLGFIVVVAAYVAPLVLAFFNWSKTPPAAFLSLLAIPPIVFGIGWAGAQNPTDQTAMIGFALTVAYFAIFLVVFPVLARRRTR